MAAAREPSMEDILASIKRVIAEEKEIRAAARHISDEPEAATLDRSNPQKQRARTLTGRSATRISLPLRQLYRTSYNVYNLSIFLLDNIQSFFLFIRNLFVINEFYTI